MSRDISCICMRLLGNSVTALSSEVVSSDILTVERVYPPIQRIKAPVFILRGMSINSLSSLADMYLPVVKSTGESRQKNYLSVL